jgi:hypothetical protein
MFHSPEFQFLRSFTLAAVRVDSTVNRWDTQTRNLAQAGAEATL